jgi:hypothetical protein
VLDWEEVNANLDGGIDLLNKLVNTNVNDVAGKKI